MAGAQVVQIYIDDVCSTCPKPERELKAYRKIFLKPGESRKFEFTLSEKDFEYFDSDYDKYLSEEGYYDIIVATSVQSDDIAAIRRVYKEGVSPYTYGINSKLKVFYENTALKESLFRFWESAGYDFGLLESSYQYTPDKKLYEILPKIVGSDTEINQYLERFLEEVSKTDKR